MVVNLNPVDKEEKLKHLEHYCNRMQNYERQDWTERDKTKQEPGITWPPQMSTPYLARSRSRWWRDAHHVSTY